MNSIFSVLKQFLAILSGGVAVVLGESDRLDVVVLSESDHSDVVVVGGAELMDWVVLCLIRLVLVLLFLRMLFRFVP